nr:MAG TPA: hypothetical protein [Caudoviricetes sp.]
MAKTLIGNIKGKNGRGITSIKKTGTTGSVDTYTITYTDSTTSTFTINNSDSISLQRQIVPSAAVESSATASQAYAAGDYVVVNGFLRRVKAAIAKGNTIGDSNSTATTVTGEIATALDSASRTVRVKTVVPDGWHGELTVATDVDEGGSSGGETGRFAELRGYIWSYDASADPWNNAVRPPSAPGDADTWWVKIPERLSWSGKVDTRTCGAVIMKQSSEGMGYDFFGTYKSDCFLANDGYAYLSFGNKGYFTAKPAGMFVNCKFYLR